uniref:Uncharacterized protein n=1 Tax=Avena sativa TaxID=4498 RepID=A0ACD5X288_AVESA
MDKSWLRAPRTSPEYGEGLRKFIEFAAAKSGRNNIILCSCQKCGNRFWLVEKVVHDHLICEGFMSGYDTWIFHGEIRELGEDTTDSDEDPMDIAETDSDSDHYVDTDEMSQMLIDGFGMYNSATLGEDEEVEEE